MTLLPFEGDSARPLRWRVAQLLKRSGHTVLGFSPSRNPESRADLQAYAQRREVEAFVSGQAVESPNGWELSLAVLDASGKPKAAALKFHAASLSALVKVLKSDGQSRLDEAMQGQARPVTTTVLPLPRRARRAPAPSPAPDPTSDEASEAPPPSAARAAAPAAGESWDADSDGGDSRKATSKAARKRPAAAPPKEQPAAAPASAPTRDRGSAALRLAMASSASKESASKESASKESAPRESASKGSVATKPVVEREARDSAEATRPLPTKRSATEATADPARDLAPLPGEVDLDADSASGEIEESAAEPEPSSTRESSKGAAAEPAAKGKRLSLFGHRSAKTPAVGESSGTAASEEGGATPEDQATDETKDASKAKVPSAVLGVEAGLVRRNLKYSDDLYKRLRAPTTNDWVYRFDAEFFPFARPVKERLSLLASYESTLAGKVHDGRVDRNFNVNFSELAAGMRVRQALGPHEIGLQVTIGRLNTGLEDPQHLSGVPEFTYVLLTPSLDGKLRFGPATVQGSIGYRRALGSYGEASSADWFPHMDGYGIDGKLGLEYRISDQVAFQFAGSMRRFILTMNSKPADAVGGVAEVAAGAVDSYFAGYFGLSLTL